jgi:hypothetical protein
MERIILPTQTLKTDYVWNADGKTIRPMTAVETAIAELVDLSEEQRLEVINYFCTSCGKEDPEGRCVCMRDD